MSSWKTLIFLFVLRLLSVYVVRSWFVPDEVYQSSEVAHKIVFSSGHLSWEWSAALRSILHPTFVTILYLMLSYLNLASQPIISIAPRLQHASFFAIGDFAYFKLADRILPTSDGAYYAKATYLSSWFVFYCGSRTLSNSLETTLTLIALLWYPWEGVRYRGIVWPYMAFGFLTIVIRPTAALIWLVLGLVHLLGSQNPYKLIFRTAIPTCLIVVGISIGLDSLYYGKLTSTAWNFLMFNVLTGGSAHFGVHSWHWLFTEGLTSVLTVQLLPIIFGLISPLRPQLLPFITSMFYILFHSLLPHKEQRFLLPIIPFMCFYGGAFFADRRYQKSKRIFYWMMIIVNLIVALYTGLIHQIGPYQAADAILKRSHGKENILALMPCYSLPGHSYFHDKIGELRQLDCSPDFEGKGSLDEADTFFENPSKWLTENQINHFGYIAIYEKTYLTLTEDFTERRFAPCERLFHSHFLTSSRQDHYILVLCNSRIPS